MPTLSRPESKPIPRTTPQTAANSARKSPVLKNTPASFVRPSNKEIKRMVEETFPIKGQAEASFEGIVAMLNTLADRYKDDQIRELYYFNEKDEKFHWDEKLLS